MPGTCFSKDYIIRIYKHNSMKARPLIGTVEKVGDKVKQAFTTREELWEILNTQTLRREKDEEQT